MDTAFADTNALRAEASRLLEDVVRNLLEAVDETKRTPTQTADFDCYGTEPVYTEAATAWRGELRVLAEAVEDLVDKIRKSAHDYDSADDSSAENISRIR